MSMNVNILAYILKNGDSHGYLSSLKYSLGAKFVLGRVRVRSDTFSTRYSP